MFEFELKFQIPEEKRDALNKAFQRKTTQQKTLYAKYFDTAQFDLSKQSISLRQRLENDQWRQTLKLPTENALNRAEFENVLGHIEVPLDLDLYSKEKQISKKIKKLLNPDDHLLEVKFSTQVERKQNIFAFQNSTIEVSYDQGKILADDRELILHELEFELKQGTVQDLVSFVLPRLKRYGLWLDTRSKAQQGCLLAQNLHENPVQYQTAIILDQKDHTETALKKILNNCLMHLLPNSSAIASGNFNAQHIHQARVAIRRLRSALKTFSSWSTQIDPTWQPHLAELFRQLGLTRDLDVLREELLPRLIAEGAPAFKLPEIEKETPDKLTKLFRGFNFNCLVLSILQFIYQESYEYAQSTVKKVAIKKINKLHHHIQANAENFLNLAIEDRHQTRKDLKRLRYSIEFITSLYPTTEIKHYIKAIKPAQESLGKYNDLFVAEALLQKYVQTEEKIWFALGWIAAEKNRVLLLAHQDLLNFAKVKPL